MELVYLWIENKSEIIGNEFNFGAEYTCTYNNGDFTFNRNTKYIKKFYSSNVNISSIIGENGSGKSQLLKLIWNGSNEDKEGIINKFFAVVLIDNKLKLIGAISDGKNTLAMDSKTKYSELDFDKQVFKIKIINTGWENTQLSNLTSYLFTNEAVCLKPIANNVQISTNQVFFSTDCIDKKIINSYGYKYFNNKWLKPIERYLESVRSSLASYEQDMDLNRNWIKETRKKLRTEAINNEIIILENKIKRSALTEYKYELLRSSKNYEKIISIATDDDVVWFDNFKKPSLFFVSFSINDDLENKIRNYLVNFPNILEIYKNINKYILNEKVFIFYTLSWYIDLFDTSAGENIIEKYLEQLNIIESKFDKQSIELFLNRIVDEFSYLENGEKIYFSFAKDYFNNLKTVILKIDYFSTNKNNDVLLIDINSKNKKAIKELIDAHIAIVAVNDKTALGYAIEPTQSSGYYQTLLFIANLYHDIQYKCKDKNVLLLLDEIEAFLHPDWQRQFIELMVNFLSTKFKEKKFHVILASHSPFILSDLTKDRILVLHKDSKDIDQTFGTNIHSLLSSSFFLGDNLMGSFSTKKIEQYFDECEMYSKTTEKNKTKNKKLYQKDRDGLYTFATTIGVDYLQIALLNNLKKIDSIFDINEADDLEKEKILQKIRENPAWLDEI